MKAVACRRNPIRSCWQVPTQQKQMMPTVQIPLSVPANLHCRQCLLMERWMLVWLVSLVFLQPAAFPSPLASQAPAARAECG